MTYHYGAHNLASPPSSTGRILEIKIPKPRTLEDCKALEETYLIRCPEGDYCDDDGYVTVFSQKRTFEDSAKLLYQRVSKQIKDHLKHRVLIDCEGNRYWWMLHKMTERQRMEWAEAQRQAWVERQAANAKREREYQAWAKADKEQREREKAEQQRQQQEQAEFEREWQWLMGPPLEDCYRLLGVRAGASQQEIKKAYRTKAMLCHPDLTSHHGLPVPEATARFQALASGYDRISRELG